MDGVPPPPPGLWTARGTKRSHSQISVRDRGTSRSTRSPSTVIPDRPTRTQSTTSAAASTSLPPIQSQLRPSFSLDRHSASIPSLTSLRELALVRQQSDEDLTPQPQDTTSASGASTGRSTPMEVIDLTGEPDTDLHDHAPQHPHWRPFGRAQRGPRFPAEIIDLSDDTPQRPWQPQQQEEQGTHEEPVRIESPEIEFLRQRQRSPRLLWAGATPPAGRIPNRLNSHGRVTPIEIQDDDDVQIIRERRLTPQPLPTPPPPGHMANLFNVFGGAAVRLLGDVGIIATRDHGGHVSHHRHHRRGQAVPIPREYLFEVPNLDFGAAAFDLGYADHETRREREDSVIQPPQPAPEGFTRNPKEKDVLVCPNCDAELSVGDNDVKRQVWLSKGCGHVYCGECAVTRNTKTPRSGKQPVHQRIKPLKSCVVEGCKTRTTGKSMIQLFL